MVSFCFKRNSTFKKSSVSKIHEVCSNTNLSSLSLYYEPWQIRNPDIFVIRGFYSEPLNPRNIQKFDGTYIPVK